MAYEKQTWDTNSFVNPTRMNHIESGIEANSNSVDELTQGASDMSTEIIGIKQNIVDQQTEIDGISQNIVDQQTEIDGISQNIVDLVSASEWKLVGTKTDKTDLALPADWKELKFVFKFFTSVYTKTYDRFSVNEDIIAYVESYYYNASDNSIVNLNLSLSRVNVRNAKRNGVDYSDFILIVYYR